MSRTNGRRGTGPKNGNGCAERGEVGRREVHQAIADARQLSTPGQASPRIFEDLLGAVPPHSPDAERAVLGAMLVPGLASAPAPDPRLLPSDFYVTKHRTIFAAMLSLSAEGRPLELLTLKSALETSGQLQEVGGAGYLAGLTEVMPTAANLGAYCESVLDYSRRRSAIKVGMHLVGAGLRACSDPWPAIEAQRLALQTVIDRGSARGGEGVPVLVNMSDVEPQAVSFLWEPYIPRGKITFVSGDPGSGKTWIALAIATAVSRGRGLPGRDGPLPPRPPANVVYMTAEDDLEDTIRPRLDQLGADPSRVVALQGRRGSKGEVIPVKLADLDVLNRALEETRAELLVLDPLQAFLGADVDMNRANETRGVMSPIKELAEKHRVAVLFVRHLSKGGTGRALHRGIGSIDFTALTRSELMAGTDARGEERAIVHLKSSCAQHGSSLRYTLDGSGFAWAGLSTLGAGDLLAPELAQEDAGASATEVLAELLADGPMPAKEVERLAKERGVSKRSLERARARLGVCSSPIKRDTKVIGWELSLPGQARAASPAATPPDRQSPGWRCGGVDRNSMFGNGNSTPPGGEEWRPGSGGEQEGPDEH